jgi:hypothetical protein
MASDMNSYFSLVPHSSISIDANIKVIIQHLEIHRIIFSYHLLLSHHDFIYALGVSSGPPAGLVMNTLEMNSFSICLARVD